MPEPIRVAHVMGKMLGGGVEQVVMNYYRNIDRSCIQFDFIVDADSPRVPTEEILDLGGRIFTVPPYQKPVLYQRELSDLFENNGWLIVHSHINAMSVFPLHAAAKAGVPVRIAHSHSTGGSGEPIKNVIKSLLKKQANRYPTNRFACSDLAGKWLFGNGANFEIIKNAINLESFCFNPQIRQRARSELGINEGTFVLGHVGRLVTQKNQEFLLEVFANIEKQMPDSRLLIVGDGPLRAKLEKRVEILNLVNKVLFLPNRSEVGSLYQAFDAFCLPSNYEGLGMVAVEAQVAGLPTYLSEHVPSEAYIAPVARSLHLDQGPEFWAAVILENRENKQRVGYASAAKAKGYDISRESVNLAVRYTSLFEAVNQSELKAALND